MAIKHYCDSIFINRSSGNGSLTKSLLRQSSSATNIAVFPFVRYCVHCKYVNNNNNNNKNNTNLFLGVHVVANVQLARVFVLASEFFLV